MFLSKRVQTKVLHRTLDITPRPIVLKRPKASQGWKGWKRSSELYQHSTT
ncbi:hypothetical protein NC651_003916 [Populus alba x Populus x berolinensis]|nr:hypothetical protein NC651_003916 [Populus alba x Populus x berolinensis]